MATHSSILAWDIPRTEEEKGMAGKSGVGQRQLIDSKTRPGSELSPKQL